MQCIEVSTATSIPLLDICARSMATRRAISSLEKVGSGGAPFLMVSVLGRSVILNHHNTEPGLFLALTILIFNLILVQYHPHLLTIL